MGGTITLYQEPRNGGSAISYCSEYERIIPAGHPYLLKRNGKFLWARSKHPKRLEVAATGDPWKHASRIKRDRQRSRSVQPEQIPMLVGGDPFVPPGLQSQNTAPLLQSAFGSPMMSSSFPQQAFMSPTIPFPPFTNPPIHPQYVQYLPTQPLPPHAQQMLQGYQVYDPMKDNFMSPNDPAAVEKAKHDGLEQLKQVDAHFRKVSMEQVKAKSGDEKKKKREKKADASVQKHVCANCGNLRSKKYHHENPIKPGETPAPSFCGKCQKDDTECSESETEDETLKPHETLKKSKKSKDNKDKVKEKTQEERPTEQKPMEEKSKKNNQQPTVEDANEPETIETDKAHEEPAIKETSKVSTYKDEYVIVEEEVSEEDHGRRGRSHKQEHGRRQEPVDTRHQDHHHHRCVCREPPSRERSVSQRRYERYELPQQPRRRQRRQESNHSRQSSVPYRHVPAPKRDAAEGIRESFSQKIPVHHDDHEYSSGSASRSSDSRKSRAAPSQQSHRTGKKVSVQHDDYEYSPDSAFRSRSPRKHYASSSKQPYRESKTVPIHYDEHEYSPESAFRSRSPSPGRYYTAPTERVYEERKEIPVQFSEQEHSQVFESRSRSPKKNYAAPTSEQPYYNTGRSRQSSVSTRAEWLDESQLNHGPSWNDYQAGGVPPRKYYINPERSPDQPAHGASRKYYINPENNPTESIQSQGGTSQHRPARRTSPQSTANPWDEPHDLHADSHVEARRVQEALEREFLNCDSPRKPSQNSSAKNDASKYYTDDWSAEEELNKRRGATEVNYDYDDGWIELPAEDEYVPGAWPEGLGYIYGGTYTAQEIPEWHGGTGQDERNYWSDTESWKERRKEKRLVHIPRPSVPQPTDSQSAPSGSFEKRRLRWANEYETSPSLSAEETPRRASRSHEPIYERGDNYRSSRAASYAPPLVSPHVSFGGERVTYFDDGTPRGWKEDTRSEISGMTEAERVVASRGVRRERRKREKRAEYDSGR